MKTNNYQVDFCVVGGGFSGLCCAIASARKGIKTVLIQDRAVLGGNASSEIRMHVCGAHGIDNRETGILEEILLENFYQNTGLKYPIWDGILYEKARFQPNLTLLLNSSCIDAEMDGNKIVSVKAWQSNAESYHIVNAKYFADCSGDSILAPLSNAEFMYGREAKSDFNETIPPDVADKKTMGMSCLFQIRETPNKVTFIPPKWANKYETDEDLNNNYHGPLSNFWWIELGGEGDSLHDTDKYRDELLKICYGVWDHMKNKGDHGLDNWELEWIGFLPGKRETRRYVGKYIINQNDVEAEGRFEDIVAYAGWKMDDHFPQGFNYPKGNPTTYYPAPSPWGIPLRALISKNIDNLVFAGRNISVTHAAFSSTRVMATCAILGQAIGTAVALAIKDDCKVENVDINKLQQTLMYDDCYIPFKQRELSSITKSAKCSSEIVRNGLERGEQNLWKGQSGDFVEYTFDKPTKISEIRLVFDSDLNRKYENMPGNIWLNETKFKLPKTLINEYKIEMTLDNGKIKTISVDENHQRLAIHRADEIVTKIKFIPISTNGCEEFRLFAFEMR